MRVDSYPDSCLPLLSASTDTRATMPEQQGTVVCTKHLRTQVHAHIMPMQQGTAACTSHLRACTRALTQSSKVPLACTGTFTHTRARTHTAAARYRLLARTLGHTHIHAHAHTLRHAVRGRCQVCSAWRRWVSVQGCTVRVHRLTHGHAAATPAHFSRHRVGQRTLLTSQSGSAHCSRHRVGLRNSHVKEWVCALLTSQSGSAHFSRHRVGQRTSHVKEWVSALLTS